MSYNLMPPNLLICLEYGVRQRFFVGCKVLCDRDQSMRLAYIIVV